MLTPRSTVTFTITRAPARPAERKTLERLIRMQPEIQRGLHRLSRRRKLVDNVAVPRAGRMWVNRVRPSKLAPTEPGQTFTLRITPQIIPDLRSVEKYLAVKEG